MKMDLAAERETMFDHVYKQHQKRFYNVNMGSAILPTKIYTQLFFSPKSGCAVSVPHSRFWGFHISIGSADCNKAP